MTNNKMHPYYVSYFHEAAVSEGGGMEDPVWDGSCWLLQPTTSRHNNPIEPIRVNPEDLDDDEMKAFLYHKVRSAVLGYRVGLEI